VLGAGDGASGGAGEDHPLAHASSVLALAMLLGREPALALAMLLTPGLGQGVRKDGQGLCSYEKQRVEAVAAADGARESLSLLQVQGANFNKADGRESAFELMRGLNMVVLEGGSSKKCSQTGGMGMGMGLDMGMVAMGMGAMRMGIPFQSPATEVTHTHTDNVYDRAQVTHTHTDNMYVRARYYPYVLIRARYHPYVAHPLPHCVNQHVKHKTVSLWCEQHVFGMNKDLY
jgi:hypothetical protein